MPRRLGLLAATAVAGVVVCALAIGIGAANQPPRTGQQVVALVDSAAISLASVNEYRAVFTDPSGSARVGDDKVLLSLINQEIVSREARRLGIRIDSAEVEGAINSWLSLGVSPSSLDASGGLDGLRHRFERFYELRGVKRSTIGAVAISDDAVQAAYDADPSLHAVSLEEAAKVLRPRLTASETDRRWTAWLAAKRACARIEILDPTLGVPGSTPLPSCPAGA